MKFESQQGGHHFMHSTFFPAAQMVAGMWSVREYIYNSYGQPIDYNYKRPLAGRAWFKLIYNKYQLHPAIEKVIEGYNYRPNDWQQLLLEWPHRSETDSNRIAYTQNERKGEANIQTVTTLGKYLQRHFTMPDHEIRDVVALYTSTGTMEIRAHMEIGRAHV